MKLTRKKYENMIQSLRRIVGGSHISTLEQDLLAHAKDTSYHPGVKPDIVVWPKDTPEVSKILRFANKNKIPVTAWGRGSSLEGNSIPVYGGIVLDMTRMNKIIKVYPDDLQVHVQSGIIGDELNELLGKKYGLTFPAVSGSSFVATVGGMIANNSGGMHAVKYGVVGDWVLALEVVLANGDIVRTGSRSFKSVSGYDLTALFTGSEGTLGVITEVTLKLAPLPQIKLAIMAAFPSVKDAVQMPIGLLTSDCQPAAIEFMDASYMVLVNQAKKTNLPETPTLIIELQGDKSRIVHETGLVKTFCRKNKSISYMEFKTAKQVKLLRDYRRAVRPMITALLPHNGVISAEVGLPLSQVHAFLKKADDVSQKYGLQTILFGHMGDGSFHGWAMYELDNKQSWKTAIKLNADLVKFAIKAGGTTSGENGIGIGKRPFLPIEHPSGLPVMKKIKRLFDPNGILNPGKVFLD